MFEYSPKMKKPEGTTVTMNGGGASGTEVLVDASPTEVVETVTYDKNAPLTSEQSRLVGEGYNQMKAFAMDMFYKMRNGRTDFQSDDFISWGTEGSMEAVKKFDPSKNGGNFLAFALPYIKGRILDNLREQTIISRRHMMFLQERRKAIELLNQELKRKPKEEEIAEKMDLTLEQYSKKLLHFSPDAGIISLDSKFNAKDYGDARRNVFQDSHFEDILIQKENPYRPDHDEEEIKKDQIELLNKFLTKLKLSERDRKVVNMYIIEGRTVGKIADELNLTHTRISQIRIAVIEKLRKLFEQEGYHINHEDIKRKYNGYQKEE